MTTPALQKMEIESRGRAYAIGEKVVVLGGRFRDFRGKVVAVDQRMVTVEVTVFGRAILTGVDQDQLTIDQGSP